ncbi:hypothetical protein KKB83_01440 [Patescibacteria group bacterium]|nr:hypothetical protein [Patescibacteria group bacterium]
MTSTVQTLLIIMIILLGTTLTVIGAQVYFVFKELRESVKRTNKILLDVEVITDGVANGAVQITETLGKIKDTLSLAMIGKRVWEIIRGEEQEEQDN